MIDIQALRDNPEKVKKAVSDKQFNPLLVDKALELDQKRRELLQETEKLRAERNKVSKSGDEEARSKGKEIKAKLKDIEPKLKKIEEEFSEVFNQIPNPSLPQVPIGKSEKDNVEVRKWGEPRKFEFEPKDHLELGKNLGILDFETGAKVSGSQFYFLYGDGALMELALIQYAFEL